MSRSVRSSDYDYELPPELVARYPAARRDASRLLAIGQGRALRHLRFGEIGDLMRPGDVLVVNDSKVIPARVLGRKTTGAKVELLLLRPAAGSSVGDPDASSGNGRPASDPHLWEALARPARRLGPGHNVLAGGSSGLRIEVVGKGRGGLRIVKLRTELTVLEAIERFGAVPLPPYLGRDAEEADRERYQTVYARKPGSVAAPTAGLHFTPELLAHLKKRGIRIASVTLHVGPGTFRVGDQVLEANTLHSEFFDLPERTARAVNRARDRGGRVWAVGTTSVRALESQASPEGKVRAGSGTTELFIKPPYHFRAVDALVTNFHLPKSSLLMLVAAFGGYDRAMNAYREAVSLRYRFYSYGDAMAIVR